MKSPFGNPDKSTGGIAIDKAAPTVLLSSPVAAIGEGSLPITATFERAVTGFTAEDVLLTNATLSAFAGEGALYTFTLTPLAEGVFTAVIPFGAAMDGGNLENAPSNVLMLTLDPLLLLHNADTNGDGKISLSELLRVIQFYNTPGYHCNPANIEDGFEPGLTGDKTCEPHSSDYKPQNWLVSLSELLRSVQIYNIGNYRYCNDEQLEGDGYCVDVPPAG